MLGSKTFFCKMWIFLGTVQHPIYFRFQETEKKRYTYVKKLEDAHKLAEARRYKYVKKASAPKNFDPQPKSRNRYVYVEKKNCMNRYKVR